MIFVLLNLAAVVFFLYFTVHLDKRISFDSFEPSNFSVALLFGTIESGLLTLLLACRNNWLGALSTPLMKLILSFDGLIFIYISFGFISLAYNTRKGIIKLIKYGLCLFCVILVITQFKQVEISLEQGITILSEYLFDGPARTYFPWTWYTVFTFTFKLIIPIISLLFLFVLQEKKSTQLQKYQSAILLQSIILMWIIHTIIRFVSVSIPAFSLLFTYAYLSMIVVIIIALTKTTVPSGKGIAIFLLKVIASYLAPAAILAVLFCYFQPRTSIFHSPYLAAFIALSIIGIVYSLWISEFFSSSKRFYTAEYEGALEQDLASIDYQNAEMDEIINKMNTIIRKNVEASSLNVFILEKQNELETAYSSNNLSLTIPVNNPIFDTLLNNNKNVVIWQELEKEHSVSVISNELAEFFETTKSDALFILNEGHNIFGLITLGRKTSGDHYKEYDYNVFTKLYSYFFVFGYYMRNISNKDIISVVNREIKMSSQIITSIQDNIDHIKNDKVDTGYLMVPAHNIGGEFIDLIRLTDTRHLLVVGDLSGKGIAASMNMVILKSIIRTYLSETHDFKELVVKVNSFVRDSLRKGTIFAGLFALIDFETDTMYYINCGIPALMMYTQVYNNVIEIQGSGHILGFVKDISPFISVKTTKLNRGDIILACTDGMINSHSLRGEQFGKERVQQALLDNSTYPAQRMAQFTFDSLTKFMSKEMEDDVSILILKYESSVKYVDQEIEENKLKELERQKEVEQASESTDSAGASDSTATATDNESQIIEEESGIPDSVEETPAESEPSSSPVADDMPLPDGFEMPDLSNLDDMLKEAGL